MHRVLAYLVFLSLNVLTLQNVCVTGNYYWRDFSFGTLPSDAVEIANDGKYIAQVYFEGGLLPATIYPHLGIAVTELNGRIFVRDNIKMMALNPHFFFKILCTPEPGRLYWEIVDFDKVADRQMKDAVVGGFQKNEFNVFIGKAFHEGQWKVGKVIPIETIGKGLRIWDADGKVVTVMKFQMLKYNSTI